MSFFLYEGDAIMRKKGTMATAPQEISDPNLPFMLLRRTGKNSAEASMNSDEQRNPNGGSRTRKGETY